MRTPPVTLSDENAVSTFCLENQITGDLAFDGYSSMGMVCFSHNNKNACNSLTSALTKLDLSDTRTVSLFLNTKYPPYYTHTLVFDLKREKILLKTIIEHIGSTAPESLAELTKARISKEEINAAFQMCSDKVKNAINENKQAKEIVNLPAPAPRRVQYSFCADMMRFSRHKEATKKPKTNCIIM